MTSKAYVFTKHRLRTKIIFNCVARLLYHILADISSIFSKWNNENLNFGTVARACPLTSRRHLEKSPRQAVGDKSYKKRGQPQGLTVKDFDAKRQYFSYYLKIIPQECMESMRSIEWNPLKTAWNQDRRGTENTACRLMPYADKPQFHTIRLANWCHTKPFGLG